MSLQEKLQRIAEASAKQIPAASQTVMKRCIQAVADSLPQRRLPKIGDALPPFALPDSTGNVVRSSELTAAGPLILVLFRGKW